MRYRFTVMKTPDAISLRVTSWSADSSGQFSSDVVVTQMVEDFAPSRHFRKQIIRTFPKATLVADGVTFTMTWPFSHDTLNNLLAQLNALASPDRYGRTGESYVDMIGKTPLVKLKRLAAGCRAQVLVKVESMEPGSVKDRAVLSMVQEAMRRGDIDTGTEVVEASSGNLAFSLSAVLGILAGQKPTIFMSKMHGPAKRRAVRISGSRIILTGASEGIRSAKRAAMAYADNRENTFQIQPARQPGQSGSTSHDHGARDLPPMPHTDGTGTGGVRVQSRFGRDNDRCRNVPR